MAPFCPSSEPYLTFQKRCPEFKSDATIRKARKCYESGIYPKSFSWLNRVSVRTGLSSSTKNQKRVQCTNCLSSFCLAGNLKSAEQDRRCEICLVFLGRGGLLRQRSSMPKSKPRSKAKATGKRPKAVVQQEVDAGLKNPLRMNGTHREEDDEPEYLEDPASTKSPQLPPKKRILKAYTAESMISPWARNKFGSVALQPTFDVWKDRQVARKNHSLRV